MYDIIHAIGLQLELEIAMTITSDATFMIFTYRFTSAIDTTFLWCHFNKTSLDLNKQVDFIGGRDLLMQRPKRGVRVATAISVGCVATKVIKYYLTG